LYVGLTIDIVRSCDFFSFGIVFKGKGVAVISNGFSKDKPTWLIILSPSFC
jgi:hypothetical protein